MMNGTGMRFPIMDTNTDTQILSPFEYPIGIAPLSSITGTIDTKNVAKIEWLTSSKAARRFMFSAFNKRDFFKALEEGK